MTDWSYRVSHPIWPDEPTLENTETNRLAAELANIFYLSRGFAEGPEWEALGSDERYGWIGLAKQLLKLRDAP